MAPAHVRYRTGPGFMDDLLVVDGEKGEVAGQFGFGKGECDFRRAGRVTELVGMDEDLIARGGKREEEGVCKENCRQMENGRWQMAKTISVKAVGPHGRTDTLWRRGNPAIPRNGPGTCHGGRGRNRCAVKAESHSGHWSPAALLR